MNGDPGGEVSCRSGLDSGGADLRSCSLRPLKVGGAQRPINGAGEIFKTEAGVMNGIILFAAPAVAALGALVLLGLFVQARNAAKTNQSRVRIPVRRPR